MSEFDISKIKMIVGLGNPGREYDLTRHNIGFEFLDFLKTEEFKEEPKFYAHISKSQISGHAILLVKPTTFMNNSGKCVQSLLNFYKIKAEAIVVVHDDLDIEFGEIKLQFDKGPKVHNGVNDIETHLNTSEFWRLRIGVESRTPEQRKQIPGMRFVLNKFSKEEETELEDIYKKSLNLLNGMVL